MILKIGDVNNIREFKGKSLLELKDDYVIIDLETTGYDAIFDSIIEIGAIKYKNNQEVNRYHCLINIEFPLNQFIVKHTGITDEMLKTGIDIEKALTELDAFVEKNDIVVAHHANFDINFLYQAFSEFLNKPFTNDFIDTLRLARNLYKDFENHKLATLVKNFGFQIEVEHRSISDCEAVNLCYQHMKSYIINNSIDLTPRKKYVTTYIKPSDFKSDIDSFDTEHPLYKMNCVFTGKLEKMPRKDAWQLVLNVGGSIGEAVNKQTNFLILGNLDYCSTLKGNKSNKQKRAEQLMLEGYDIKVISENTFYDLLE